MELNQLYFNLAVNLILTFCLLPLEYTVYADIYESDKSGPRQLIFNGFKFTQRYETKTGEITWRCTKHVQDNSGKHCSAKLKTKVFNGYEMIQSPNVKHDHC